MASNLLKTLNKIEEGRRLQIEAARELGHNVKDTASFLELATIMQEPTRKFPIQDYNIPDEYPTVTEEWVRPAEWPDCYTILREAKPYSNYYPMCILLFKNAADTIDIPIKTTTTTNKYYWQECGLEYLKLSDGTSYTLSSYSSSTQKQGTHTWDKTKDIVDSEGNTYRWIIGYLKKTYSGATNASTDRPMLNFAMFPATEILLGDITFGTNKYYTCNVLNYYSSTNASVLSNNLVHFEVLPECNLINATYGNNDCKPIDTLYMFIGCTKLECLDFGPGFIFHFGMNNNYGCYGFEGLTKLNKLDLSKVKVVMSGNYKNQTIKVWPQMFKEFKPPMTTNNWQLNYSTTSNSQWYLANYYGPIVEDLKAKGYTVSYSNYFKNISYLRGKRPNVEMENDNSTTVYQHEIQKTITSTDIFTPNELHTSYNLLHLDLSYATLAGPITISSSPAVYTTVGSYKTQSMYIPAYFNTSYITSFEFFPNLTSIIWPDNCKYRINLLGTSVTKEVVLSLFDKCIDLTGITAYYPYIFIPKKIYAELTEEELAIATNKGWEVYDALYKIVP